VVVGAARGDTNDPSEPIQLDPVLGPMLIRAGLAPENLAAAGVSSALADDVVIAVETWLGQNASTLSNSDARCFAAVTDRDALVRKVRSGLASGQEVADCPAACSEHDAAIAERTQILDTIRAAGCDVVTVEIENRLARLRVNAAAWNIPPEYLVTDRTQEEWVALRAALANERISAKYGEDPDPADQVLLATVRAEQEVATAKVNLDTNLAAVKAAWEEAAKRE
jgi:hypothetical protein